MTTGAPDDHDGLFVADFYPQLGEYLAERHATGYDAVAGRTRFLEWLATHVTSAAEEGDADDSGTRARNRLIEANRHLVTSVAERFADRGVALVDLIREGQRGLAQAAEKYDPAKGYAFEAYATWFIRQAIAKAAGPSRNKSGKGGAERV